MALDVKELLYATAYSKSDMDRFLDPEHPSFLKFDPEIGFVFCDFVMKDGIDGSLSLYTYEPKGGHRRVIHYADQPCHINTYGNSFTQCQQVSDAQTWQEVLSAHLREPIRNFGIGGHGVYSAYRRARRVEATDTAADYIILNIWDDDHVRNIDSARWPRTAWDQRYNPWAGGDAAWPICGFPWAHLRYDLERGGFVELEGICKDEKELAGLADADHYYEVFKDDPIIHLFVLENGGEAPVEKLEALAEAFGLKLDLRDPKKRPADARTLHRTYGMRSTRFMLDKMRAWIESEGKKLMVLLSYDTAAIVDMVERSERLDQEIVDYLEKNNVTYVDCLVKAAEDYKAYNLSLEDYLKRFYIPAAGAAVFGHYGPDGNHWFAYAVKSEIVNWLDPKPPAYRQPAMSW